MACLKTSIICLVLMTSVKSSQAQHDPSLSGQTNISVAEAVASAENAKDWMQMQNSGRTSGPGCSDDKCVKSCEQDWEKNGDHCYLWNTDKKNWTDAEDFCRKEGGHLASVHSNATFDFVLEGLNRMNRTVTGLEMAWLGGNDIEVDGTWKWVDCSPWNNLTFWARGEPNNAGAGEHCLHHVFNFPPATHLNHKWNDLSCSSERGFLCSKSICSGDNEYPVPAPTGKSVSEPTGSAVTGESVSEPTGSTVTGESVVWRSASISLAATLLLLFIFF